MIARAALLAALFLAGCTPAPNSAEALIADAQEAVKRELRDPESAQFREVRAYPERRAVCGEVNGRNGYGGYAGFTLFAYADGSAATVDDPAFSAKHQVCLDGLQAQTDKIRAGTRDMLATMNQADPKVQEIMRDVNAADAEVKR